MYVQIKDKLQHQKIEWKYKGYQLEGDELLTYKNIICIPNVADLRRIVMDEIHQDPYYEKVCYSMNHGIHREVFESIWK